MDYRTNPARLFALVVGATLVVVGLIGFLYESAFTNDEAVRDGLFGLFDVNGWHNVVHLLTGIVALAMANTRAREFALGFGVAYLAVAIWGFIVGDGGSILSIIPVNTADNILHLLFAASGLAVYALTARRRERMHSAHPGSPTTA